MNLPRFFSYLSDEELLKVFSKRFEVIKFDPVDIKSKRPGLHFQSLLLRKRKNR